MVSQLFELPGLQIFLPQRERTNSSGDKLNNLNEIPIEKPLSNIKNLNDLTRIPSIPRYMTNSPNMMHDYSPTVVGDESFGSSQVNRLDINNNIKVTELAKIRQEIQILKDNILLGSYEQFNDEFKYYIVSSYVLNDYTPHLEKLQVQRSILDLKQSMNKPDQYIDHKEDNKNFDRFTLRCIKAMVGLRRIPRISSYFLFKSSLLLLKAVYIIQKRKQSVLDMNKYKMMMGLKCFLKQLAASDILFHKVLLNYKTLRNGHIFNNSSPSIECQLKDHDLDDEISKFIKTFLKSNLDNLFYAYRCQLEILLAHVNEESLFKYQNMYGINHSDLEFFFNNDVKHLGEKSDRLDVIQKFFLCCLLSVSFDENRAEISEKLRNMFHLKFMPANKDHNRNNFNLHILVTNILADISKHMESSSKLLVNYKNFLDGNIVTDDPTLRTSKLAVKNDELQVSRLLSDLELRLQAIADSSGNNGNAQRQFIKNKLNRIIRTICIDSSKDDDKDKFQIEESTYKYHILNQKESNDKRIISTSSSVMDKNHRGFSLDIIRHSNTITDNELSVDRINLNEAVEFTPVDNSTTTFTDDETYDSVNSIYQNSSMLTDINSEIIDEDNTEDTCIPPIINATVVSSKMYHPHSIDKYKDYYKRKSQHYESLHKLSDDELRYKLNEKIMNFASENKTGKTKLRAQKSFELLKRQQNNNLSDPERQIRNLRNISDQLSTEDTIPIIYEMRELADNTE